MTPRPRWIAVAVLLASAVGSLAFLRSLPAADAGPALPVPRLAACAARPALGGGTPGQPGTTYRLEAHLDANGALVGQRLFVGRDGRTTAAAELGPGGSASGPVDGVVALVDDDGAASTLKLVSVAGGCGTTVDRTASVIRRTLIDRVDGSVLLHALDRGSRADLGVWRLGVGAATPTRLVAPLPASLGFGPVWATDLRLDAAGSTLAVQSCLDVQCLTRIVDLTGARPTPLVLRDPRQGALIGFAGADVVTWAACDGFPCDVLAWHPGSTEPRILARAVSAAGLTGDGAILVVASTEGAGDHAFVVDPALGRAVALRGLGAGERPISDSGLATAGLELAPDAIAVARPAGAARSIHPTRDGEVLP